MKFYHRTTEKRWESIQKEGVLWGLPYTYFKTWEEAEKRKENWDGYPRYTYLSPTDQGESYGTVLLEVEYFPSGPPNDNFGKNPPPGQECWQFSVFIPIGLDKVKRVRG